MSNQSTAAARLEFPVAAANLVIGQRDQHSMTSEQQADEIAEILARAAPLPLKDAAWMLDRDMLRLDGLEGRPTKEQVRLYRAMTPEQQNEHRRHKRQHADEGPMFGYLKRTHPQADDTDVRAAILEAVRFQDDCSRFLRWDGDFWDCIVRAVAEAAKKHPGFLEQTYNHARNHLAYLWK
jgi:hypothetical protein